MTLIAKAGQSSVLSARPSWACRGYRGREPPTLTNSCRLRRPAPSCWPSCHGPSSQRQELFKWASPFCSEATAGISRSRGRTAGEPEYPSCSSLFRRRVECQRFHHWRLSLCSLPDHQQSSARSGSRRCVAFPCCPIRLRAASNPDQPHHKPPRCSAGSSPGLASPTNQALCALSLWLAGPLTRKGGSQGGGLWWSWGESNPRPPRFPVRGITAMASWYSDDHFCAICSCAFPLLGKHCRCDGMCPCC